MIERKGTHICERCGKSYDWIARKQERDEIVIGCLDDIRSHNIQFFDVVNGYLVATGHCPFCGAMQMTRLVEEMVEVVKDGDPHG